MMITKYPYSFGWIPDRPSKKDLWYRAPLRLAPPPSLTDLEPRMPSVYDQGPLGSCTFNMGAGMCHYLLLNGMHQLATSDKVFTPSRLGGYWCERKEDGTIPYDAGSQIRTALKVIAKYGVAPEDDPTDPGNWPYDVTKFTEQPPDAYFKEALDYQGLSYARVDQHEASFKAVLAEGFPIGIGFTVYESFMSNAVATTGMVPMPSNWESEVGGHAIMIIGYDDSKRLWKVRNSWGASWGAKGYCFFPYEYLLDDDMASDSWVLKSIE